MNNNLSKNSDIKSSSSYVKKNKLISQLIPREKSFIHMKLSSG